MRGLVRRIGWLLLLSMLVPLSAACASGNGLPSKDGRYAVQSHSVTWDGDQYRFYWADQSGGLHQAHTKGVKLLQDDQTFLQMQSRQGTLHLQQSEPITVLAQDSHGNYTNSWFPFLAGAALGNVLSGPRSPTYYYPPTDRFSRGDELVGAVTTSAPKPPNYSTIQSPPGSVRPAAGAVAGQSSGTGGGSAATNKLGATTGQSSGGPPSGVVGGQAGGTGSGSAASDKGGFRSGSSSFTALGGSGSAASAKGGSSSSSKSSGSSRSSSSSSSSKGISGAGSGRSAPSHSAPSHSVSSGHGGGHR